MTAAEAIENIEYMRMNYDLPDDLDEALGMAVKALEALEEEEE